MFCFPVRLEDANACIDGEPFSRNIACSDILSLISLRYSSTLSPARMKLRSLLRSLILPIAALLALTAPPSRAAVEIITFGPEGKSLFFSFATDCVTTLSNGTSSPLKSGDSIACNTKWCENPDDATSECSFSSWSNQKALNSLNNEMGTKISLADITGTNTMLAASHEKGKGVCLNVGATHRVGDQITLYLFVVAKPFNSTSAIWDIGFSSLLDDYSFTRATESDPKTELDTDGDGFVEVSTSSTIGSSPKPAILRVSGTIKDTKLWIPLSSSSGDKQKTLHLGAILYTYDVPEPSSSFLALSGLALLLRRRRRG